MPKPEFVEQAKATLARHGLTLKEVETSAFDPANADKKEISWFVMNGEDIVKCVGTNGIYLRDFMTGFNAALRFPVSNALPDERKAGGEVAGNSTMYAFTKEQLSSLLFGAIEMCFEYRDVHEHTEESAKFASVNEMFEGLDAEHELVKEGVTKKLSLQSDYPHSLQAQIEGLVGACQRLLEVEDRIQSNFPTEYMDAVREALAPFQSTHPQCSICEGQEHHWQAGADHQMGAFEECMHCPAIRPCDGDEEGDL